MGPLSPGFALLDPRSLRTHEKVSLRRVFSLFFQITKRGAFTEPLLVDAVSGTILDGHHRHRVALLMRLKRVPCWVVLYLEDESITLSSRRKSFVVNKEEVIRRATVCEPYPRKTTRHAYTTPSITPHALRELLR